MGKPTGFMEYDREVSKAVEPKERIKNFDEFTSTSQRKNRRFRDHAAWHAAFPSVSQV